VSADAAAQPRLEDTGFEPADRSGLDPEHVVRIAACLDVDPAPVLAAGTLPTLWHWAFFPPSDPTANLGPDGHPRRRPEMAEFPRRMFGAGRVRVHAPLHIGEPAERTSALAGAALKEGGSGRFWVVTVAQRIEQRGVACLEEEKDFLLRSIGPTPAPGPDSDDAPVAEWVESLVPDPAFLFRFSAVTYNAHRIHYDRPYATGVEGYPDLVVHGPLTAALLVSMAERRSGRPARALSFRASAPLFVDRQIWLTGGTTADRASMTAVRCDHAVAMTMDVELTS
jgi:3-methylfumaryl-CoA hydratase